MTSVMMKRGPGSMPTLPVDSPNGSVVAPPYGEDGDVNGSMSDTTLELTVILPDGETKYVTVDSSKQMMDLTIQLCASNKLSPGSHTINVFDEETNRKIEYSASQNIGSLGVTTLHLINKKAQKQKQQQKNVPKKGTPFEKTQRLTVNLPRNQKMVTRVNPKATLANIYQMICDEKNLDPYKYELRHPTQPDQALNMASPLSDYGINEIFVVSVSAPDPQPSLDVSVKNFEISKESGSSYSTMPRKSASSSESDMSFMPGMTEKKKKKGIFSIFSRKKEGKFRPGDASYNTDTVSSVGSRSNYQAQSHKTATLPASHSSHSHLSSAPPSSSSSTSTSPPGTLTKSRSEDLSRPHHQMEPLTVNTNAKPAKPPRKKRQAPPPPPTSSSVNNTTTSATKELSLPENTHAQMTHSRASSHSSGFDETTSSPLESPGNSSRESTNTAGSSHTKASIDAASIDSSELNHGNTEGSASRSPVATSVKPPTIPEASSPTENTSSLPRSTLKKRKAPPPPPGSKSSTSPSIIEQGSTPSPTSSPTKDKPTSGQSPSSGLGAKSGHGATLEGNTSHEELKAALVEELKQDTSETQFEVSKFVDQMNDLTDKASEVSSPGSLPPPPEYSNDEVTCTSADSSKVTVTSTDISRVSVTSADISNIAVTSGDSSTVTLTSGDTSKLSVPSKDEDTESEAGSVVKYEVNKADSSSESEIEGIITEDPVSNVMLMRKTSLENDSFYADSDSGVSLPTKGTTTASEDHSEEALPEISETLSPVSTVFEDPSPPSPSTAISSTPKKKIVPEFPLDSHLTLAGDMEITFDNEEVMYVSPHQEEQPKQNSTPSSKSGLFFPPSILTDVSSSIEEEDENVEDEEPKEGEPEDILPMRGNNNSTSIQEGAAQVQKEKKKKEEEKNDEKVDLDESLEETPMFNEDEQFDLNDYRISKLIKEEIVDFSFRTINKPKPLKPEDLKKEPKAPEAPVMSLRQMYRKPASRGRTPESAIIESKMGIHRDPNPPAIQAKPEPITTEKPKIALKPAVQSPVEVSPPTPFRDANAKPSFHHQEKKIVIETKSEDVSDYIKPPENPVIVQDIPESKPIQHEIATVQSTVMMSTPVRNEPEKEKEKRKYREDVTPHPKANTTDHKRTTSPESHAMRFFGPRPYGARNKSEPSVKDVRKALAGHTQTHVGMFESKNIKDDTQVMYNGNGVVHDLSFTQSAEGEADSMMEEKSLSFMAHPTERKSILKNSSSNYKATTHVTPPWMEDKPAEDIHIRTTTTTIASPGMKAAKSAPSVNIDPEPPTRQEEEKSKKSLHSQYEELKSNFGRWQQQLIENQKLLDRKKHPKEINEPAQPVTTSESNRSSSITQKPELVSGWREVTMETTPMTTVSQKPESGSSWREVTVEARPSSNVSHILDSGSSWKEVTMETKPVATIRSYRSEPSIINAELEPREIESKTTTVTTTVLDGSDSMTPRYHMEPPGYRKTSFADRFKPAPLTRYEAAPLTKAEKPEASSTSSESTTKTHIGSRGRVSALDLVSTRQSRSRSNSIDSLDFDSVSPVRSPVSTSPVRSTFSVSTSRHRSPSPPPSVLLRQGSPSPPPQKVESYHAKYVSQRSPSPPPVAESYHAKYVSQKITSPAPESYLAKYGSKTSSEPAEIESYHTKYVSQMSSPPPQTQGESYHSKYISQTTAASPPQPPPPISQFKAEPVKKTVTTRTSSSSSTSSTSSARGGRRSDPRFEPKLDPREELMLAIRNAGGRQALSKVPVNKTKWYYSGASS